MISITDKEMSFILADMVVIIDTRECKYQHMVDYLNENNIKWVREKLETADYSFKLPNYPHLGLDGAIIIEKKANLDEIAGNFTKDRERFVREFERVDQEHIHMVIETATWKRVMNGTYRSQFPAKSMMASLLTFSIRYNCPIWFCEPSESPALIYNLLYYELRETLKLMK